MSSSDAGCPRHQNTLRHRSLRVGTNDHRCECAWRSLGCCATDRLEENDDTCCCFQQIFRLPKGQGIPLQRDVRRLHHEVSPHQEGCHFARQRRRQTLQPSRPHCYVRQQPDHHDQAAQRAAQPVTTILKLQGPDISVGALVI